MELVREFWDAKLFDVQSDETTATSPPTPTKPSNFEVLTRSIEDLTRPTSSSLGTSWGREALAVQASTKLRSMLSILNAQASQGTSLDSSSTALPQDISILSREPAISVEDLTLDTLVSDVPEPEPRHQTTASVRERRRSIFDEDDALREKVRVLLNECKRLQTKLEQEKNMSSTLDSAIDSLTSDIAHEHHVQARFTSFPKSYHSSQPSYFDSSFCSSSSSPPSTATSSSATASPPTPNSHHIQFQELPSEHPIAFSHEFDTSPTITNDPTMFTTGEWVADLVHKHTHLVSQFQAAEYEERKIRAKTDSATALGIALQEARQTLLHATKSPVCGPSGEDDNGSGSNNDIDVTQINLLQHFEDGDHTDNDVDMHEKSNSTPILSQHALSPAEQWRIILHRVKNCKRDILEVSKENLKVEAGNRDLQTQNETVHDAFERMMGMLETVSRAAHNSGSSATQTGVQIFVRATTKQHFINLRAPLPRLLFRKNKKPQLQHSQTE